MSAEEVADSGREEEASEDAFREVLNRKKLYFEERRPRDIIPLRAMTLLFIHEMINGMLHG